MNNNPVGDIYISEFAYTRKKYTYIAMWLCPCVWILDNCQVHTVSLWVYDTFVCTCRS